MGFAYAVMLICSSLTQVSAYLFGQSWSNKNEKGAASPEESKITIAVVCMYRTVR